jgi:hypothetical protein
VKIVAHELAHIHLNTTSEKPAWRLTDQWLDDYDKRHSGDAVASAQ